MPQRLYLHTIIFIDSSQAGISLTNTLISAMKLLRVRILDHIFVANNENQNQSLAELEHFEVQSHSLNFIYAINFVLVMINKNT